MKKWFVWGAILLTVINVTALGTIGYHRWTHRSDDDDMDRYRRDRMTSFEKTLGLSEMQISQMKALRDTLEQNIQPLRDGLRTRRDRFYELMSAPEVDQTAIDQVQGEMDSLQVGIKRLVIAHMLTQKRLLTPEQQKQFFSTLKKRYGNGYRRNSREDGERRDRPDD